MLIQDLSDYLTEISWSTAQEKQAGHCYLLIGDYSKPMSQCLHHQKQQQTCPDFNILRLFCTHIKTSGTVTIINPFPNSSTTLHIKPMGTHGFVSAWSILLKLHRSRAGVGATGAGELFVRHESVNKHDISYHMPLTLHNVYLKHLCNTTDFPVLIFLLDYLSIRCYINKKNLITITPR